MMVFPACGGVFVVVCFEPDLFDFVDLGVHCGLSCCGVVCAWSVNSSMISSVERCVYILIVLSSSAML